METVYHTGVILGPGTYTSRRIIDTGPFLLHINCYNPTSSKRLILEFSVALGKLCAAIFRRLLFQHMHILLDSFLPQGLTYLRLLILKIISICYLGKVSGQCPGFSFILFVITRTEIVFFLGKLPPLKEFSSLSWN